MKFERLFTPITINGMEIKNRLVMAAIHMLYTPEGKATDKFNEYYWRRAEGGVGLIIVGGCNFDDYGTGRYMMSLKADEYIPGWKNFTDGVHERGAKVAVQLYHSGAYAKRKNIVGGQEAWAPSAVFSNYSKEMPHAMTVEEIKTVIHKWGEGALRAKKAGFDAVEILGSAGYLICQFLSPVTNLREDEYGGSFENRCRFPLEVIQSVRNAVGPDYPVTMRIAGNDFVPGCNNNETAVAFARLIEKAGVDAINVTGGWHESKVPQITGDLPRSGYSYLAGAVKKAVSIPVLVSNRNNDPMMAEEVLALGRGDMIALARPLIADPDWCKKAEAGKPDEIRRCVACNQGCLAKTFFGKPVECLVNGEVGREYLDQTVKAQVPRRILVIGAGPGGAEFAIRASQRGHKVTVWEKRDHIGGQLPIVAAPFGKREFNSLKLYYETMLHTLGVELVLGKEATQQDILEAGFDAVVIAAGAVEKRIPLPVKEEGIPIYLASEILEESCIAGKDVIVVGGGSVGCETAQYLARKGALSEEQLYFLMSNKAETVEKITELLNSTDRKVSIVEIAPKIASGFEPGTAWPLLRDLKRLSVGQYPDTSITAVRKHEVSVHRINRDGTQEDLCIPCDTIVMAVGYRSDDKLYKGLREKMEQVYSIGDCSCVGKIQDAILAADKLAGEL